MSKTFDWEELQRYCQKLFHKAGLLEEDAFTVAESLVEANLRGVDSHGVVRTDIYLKRLQTGMAAIRGEMTHEKKDGVILLDGKNKVGSVVGKKALSLVIDATKENGVAIVGVKNSNHFGTCGYYLEKSVKENIAMFVFSNASQTMPPTGGIRPFLGTNPFSFAAPVKGHPPFILDMATSEVARGKIINAYERGENIPLGWAVDKHGQATTDAKEALEGAVLPMAGPKGYALSMLVDILSGVLTGSGFGKYVNNMYENWEESQNVGHFFIGVNIEHFMSLEQFKERMRSYVEQIRAEPKAENVEEIFIPGEIEYRTKESRKKLGIELPDSVVNQLKLWGQTYEIDMQAEVTNTNITS